jgi:hypothetical protein
LLNALAENYDVAVSKRNLLAGEYSILLGDYQWFAGDNYSELMGRFDSLLLNLKGNYTSTLSEFPAMNETYNRLLSESHSLKQKDTITKEEFSSLLSNFYKLFTALAVKELDNYVGQGNMIKVSLSINYCNLTTEWHNVTTLPGTTLFELTQKATNVEYTYWSTMEPGHILVSAINSHADGFWVWYYWDNATNAWIFGPVGCDAWVLRNNGIYNWTCIK